MSIWWFITTLAITSFFSSPAYAYDNNPLQDICVAVNDYKASGLNVSRDVHPKFGIAVTIVGVNDIPGFNTLGISTSRADIELQSLSPFHTHPRATELVIVMEGTLYVGFLVSDATNFFKSRLFSKILNYGDVFVFSKGLIHFLYNMGRKKATLFGSYNSQNSVLITIPSSIIASNPPIMDDILSKGFPA
ncbi:hypothetical protein HAX54_052726 [Datura stramonium]|uniref:Germin-like protein n=1 Tax=Datura stramonium TaxID=4076 RepID=A0ABS8SZD4_DATST|nr:hypothetical protein [Datura stramonium]